MAYVLAWLIVRTGPRTTVRGMQVAALVWLGFVATVLGTQYVFEARSPAYFLITTGHPLIGLGLMGAILGGWRSRNDAR